MTVILPHTFADGDTPTAAQFNGNFSAVAARAIRNADVAFDAGIDRSKLAQRYVPGTIWLQPIPYTSNRNLGAVGGGNAPQTFDGLDTTWATIAFHYFRVPAGTSAWLAALDFYVHQAANNPEVRFLVDSVTIGASAVTIATSALKRTVARPSPFANPLIPIGNDSVFQVQVQGGSGAALLGMDVTLHTKMELTA